MPPESEPCACRCRSCLNSADAISPWPARLDRLGRRWHFRLPPVAATSPCCGFPPAATFVEFALLANTNSTKVAMRRGDAGEPPSPGDPPAPQHLDSAGRCQGDPQLNGSGRVGVVGDEFHGPVHLSMGALGGTDRHVSLGIESP